jgi:autotransporter-associated beta strand protein
MKPAARLRSLLPSLALLAAGVLLTQLPSRAADTTIVWNTTSGTFSTTTNWTPNGPPSATTVLEFNATGGSTESPSLSATGTAASVWLNSASAQTVTFAGTGGTRTLNLNSTGTSTLTDGRATGIIETDGNTTGTQGTLTFNSTVALVVSTTANSNANIYVDDNTAVTIGSSITAGGTTTNLNVRGTSTSGSVTFNGVLQDGTSKVLNVTIGDNDGVAGATYNGFSNNIGTVTINGADTYSGSTTLGNVTTGATSVTSVILGNATALSSGAVKLYDVNLSGATQSSGALSASFLTGTNKLANNFTINNYAVSGYTTGFTGNDSIEIGGTVGISGTLNNNIVNTYSGTAQSLIIDGALTNTSTPTYTGSGNTTVNGTYAGSFTDNSTGTLTFSSTASASTGLTYAGSSTIINDGTYAGSIIDNMTGSLTFGTGSSFTANTTFTGTASPTFTVSSLKNTATGTTPVVVTFNGSAATTLPQIVDGTTAPTALAISTGSTAAASVTLSSTSSTYTGGTTVGYLGTLTGSDYNLVFNVGGTAGSAANTTYITNLNQLGSSTGGTSLTLDGADLSNASTNTLTFASGYLIMGSNSASGPIFGGAGNGSIVISGNFTTNFGNASSITNNIGGSGVFQVNGITYMGTSSANQNITFTGSGVTNLVGGLANSLTATGSNHGFLNYTGTGTLELGTSTFTGPNYLGNLNTTSTYGGTGQGTVLLTGNNGLSTSLVTTLSSGTLNLNGFSQTTAGLDLAGDNSHVGGVGSTASVIIPNGSILYARNNISYIPSNGSSTIATGAATISGSGSGEIFLLAGITMNIGLPATGTGSVPAGSPELTISVPITGSTGNINNIIKYGAGQVNVTGLNTIGGPTSIDAGTFNAGIFANGGSASSLGNSANTASNLVLGGGTLQYTDSTSGGSAQSTDRLFTIGDADVISGNYIGLPNGTIDASASSSSDTITFSNPGSILFGATGTGTSTNPTSLGNTTLTLTGTNTGQNTLDPLLGDPTGYKTSLIKSGVGTWVLANGGNTYSGGTTISGGILMTSNSGALGSTSGALSDTSGGTLDLDGTSQTVGSFTGGGTVLNSMSSSVGTLNVGSGSAVAANFSGVIEDHAGSGGTVAFAMIGTGTQTLSGANTYSGGTTITSGTLQTATGGTLGSTSGALADNATLDLDGTSQTVGSFTGNTSGKVLNSATSTTSLFTVGTGTTLSTTSTFSGVVENNAGTGGTVSFFKAGSGTQILNGANTYTGTTEVGGGTLQIGDGSNGVIAAASNVTVDSGATLAFNEANTSTITNAITNNGTVEGDESGTNVNTISSGITGGAFVQAGPGTTVLTGSSTFSGTTVSGGTLQLGDGTSGHNGSLGSNAVTVNGGTTLAINQFGNSTVANAITNNGSTTLTSASSGTLTLSNTLTGTGTFVQNTGTTKLTGNNSGFTGSSSHTDLITGAGNSVAVNTGGTVIIAAANALPDSSIEVNSGGTFLFSASGNNESGANVTLNGGNLSFGTLTNANETLGSLTLTANSTITFAAAASADTLTFTNLALNGYTLTVDNWSGQKYYYSGYTGPGVTGANGTTNDPGAGGGGNFATQDRLLFTGTTDTVTTSDIGNSQIQFYDDSGNFINNGKVVSYEGGTTSELVPAPEPSTCVMALGLVILAAYRERRRLASFLPARFQL